MLKSKIKKLVLFIIAFLICESLFSQNIELIGGLNNNNFYYSNKDDHYITSNYSPGYGYTIKIGIDDIKLEWLRLRFTLGYDNYNGKLEEDYYGLSASYLTIAEIEKSIISLGIFPINFKIKNKLDINLGFEISRLVYEKFEGTRSGWALSEAYFNYDLKEKYDKFSSSKYTGLIARVAYDLNLTKNIIISPQYSFYYGISNEFVEVFTGTKSMRHMICIGIEKKLK
jgi:hypothetical protein